MVINKDDAGDDGGGCYPDNDGINAGAYTFNLTVDDTGFSKLLLTTQNNSQVTLTLQNTGARHRTVSRSDASAFSPPIQTCRRVATRPPAFP